MLKWILYGCYTQEDAACRDGVQENVVAVNQKDQDWINYGQPTTKTCAQGQSCRNDACTSAPPSPPADCKLEIKTTDYTVGTITYK